MEEKSAPGYITIADGVGIENERAELEPGPESSTCAD